ncbi:UDP-N-acetylmuramoyl-L-alanyl-D-glutamate--2,6-diaminopimelate ligase [bacterium]|jgi:UDP-N-acetylmuramoyl-L-alanyl-D-glutamate--2,6-diaminopimelate ligase|nr:UDP-N-acetylmuramoyl-L-alanyl-D-glutamate--2,6-diaminopimelate ligase [bacterium]
MKKYSIDSRTINKGDIYICLPNGEPYIEEAIQRGAAGYLVMDRIQCANWMNQIYNFPSKKLVVIGVTGTNGKTSVCHFLGQALEKLGKKPYVLGTLTSPLTTPESIDIAQKMDAHVKNGGTHFVMEVSSHAIAQHRVYGIEFDITALTNISQDHLDYHLTFSSYKETKLSFIKNYGVLKLQSSDFLNKKLCFQSSLNGGFTLKNLTCTQEILRLLDYSDKEISLSLKDVSPPPGRFEILKSTHRQVVVDYAHTPDGLKNVLESAKEMLGNGSLHVVFGCGGDRDRGKRPKMARIAVDIADTVWITQDNPRTENPDQIVADILNGLSLDEQRGVEVINDRADAIETAILKMGELDMLVIAGKGHEPYQILNDRVIDFDDRLVALKVLSTL